MRVLVYGAGNIGCLYAAMLGRSGQEVTVLARGERLADLREHGIRLQPALGGDATVVRVGVVDRLEADDGYDLVLVALPWDEVADVLPILRASRGTPDVLFFGNNAAGPSALVEALGRGRVLLGFPGAAAVAREGRLRYLVTSAREQPTTLGELDGSRSPRVVAIARAMEAAGFPTAVCGNMDAWLKTHVAEIVPTACALYLADTDTPRLGRTQDALVLMLRAIREGYRVLTALGVPVTPGSHRIVRWIPEPALLWVMRARVTGEEAQFLTGHAAGARAEMAALTHDFRGLAAASGVPTPALDRLVRSLDPAAEVLPDGSAELSPHRTGMWGLGAGLAAVASLAWGVRRESAKRVAGRSPVRSAR